jgi:hypothetical protein
MKSNCITDSDGTHWWYLNGKFHRVDGPAIEEANGSRLWYLNGKLHRVDGPAMECADGTREWWLKGKLHRVDGPAFEYADGTRKWYFEGTEIEMPKCRHKERTGSVCPTCLKNFRAECKLLLIEAVQES